MNIKQLAKEVNNELGTKDYIGVLKILYTAFKVLKRTLIFGEEINIRGFFIFRLKVSNRTKGYDFKKRKKINLKKHFIPSVDFSNKLINEIKKKPLYDER